MRRTWGHRRPGVSKRPLVAVLLYVCALGSPASRAAQSPPPDSQSFPRAARTAVAHGQLTEAESMARARPAGDPAAAAVLAQVAIVHGRYDEATSLLEPAAVKDPLGDAALELALLQQQLGRTEPAARLLNTLFRQGGGTQDAEGLRRAGRAAHALGRARDANAYYRAASSAGADPAVDTAWGALFLEKYNRPEALKSFQQALKLDAQWAPAHAGVARTLADENPPAASAAAERALAIDPTLADAHLLLARLDLDNSRTEAARERIEKVLATNASQLEARALLAGIAYVRGDRAAFDAEVRQVLAINPTYGDVYRIAADLTARNYRFEEAVALTREAVALEPANTRAYGDLGLHLMRTGDEAEARRALDRAFKGDPYDVVTYNLLALLDTLDRFTVVREGDFIFKMHADEAPVLQEYAVPLAQEALRTLSAKYEYTPKGPILVEIFPRHDDFAVRTLGLPGMIGALGACFGRVVTMDSPRAGTAPGSFAWQATLWHELAHVITLQMSNQRVPRWLTEGISVYEEGRARPEWGRDMEVPFVGALERGEALKVRDLNSGFTRPETIALAYYQASLLVDHIVATHGLPALRALVRAYGDGSDADTAITKGLGVSIDTLQASFDRSLDGRFGALRAALREPKADGSRAEEGVAALKAAAAARPNSYGPQLALGRALAGAGDRAAFEALEKAAALVPMAIGEASPHALMAGLAEQLGDTRRAIKEYRALLVHDHTAIAPARRLAALAAQASDEESAAVAIERIVALDPFDAEGHTGLGRIALKRRDAQVATREFKAALALGPADRAGAHCDLGETYLLAGRLADAKREALAALEIAPTFERAQDLLLKAVDKTSAGPVKEGRP